MPLFYVFTRHGVPETYAGAITSVLGLRTVPQLLEYADSIAGDSDEQVRVILSRCRNIPDDVAERDPNDTYTLAYRRLVNVLSGGWPNTQ